ncbi:hypothetical protein IV102_26565 [bacterium]|nr:hypothetical protein [bacterium]
MFGSVAQVGVNTAKTFEDLNTGFRFRVVGDGRVEPEIADRFTSPGFIEDVEDRRLKAFATAQLACANQKEVEASLKELMGDQWSVSNYYSGGSVGALRVELVEPGAGTQVAYLDNRDMVLHLTTTKYKDGWKVEHRIQGTQGKKEWMEAATFERA